MQRLQRRVQQPRGGRQTMVDDNPSQHHEMGRLTTETVMSKTALEGVEVHPLVGILEQRGEGPVEFNGFLGTGDNRTLRLYPDLSVSAWIEIPVDSVAHWERDPVDPRRVKVFVGPKTEIAEITRRRLPARQSQMSLTRGDGILVDVSRPRLPRLNTCIGL